MLLCSNITSIGLHAMEIMEFLQLGKIGKVSVSLQVKHTSLIPQRFRSKHKKNTKSKLKKVHTYNYVYIDRDSLITMKYKQEKNDSIEYYRLLGIFSK